jgi:nucleoside 2-deoxyribosyltransferase
MPTSPSHPRIYLAGPDVFLPNAKAAGEAKARLASQAGFEGVFPLDAVLDLARLSDAEKAQRIYLADVALMDSCHLAIANLTPFRGVSMDPGTAFELGYMRAQGKPVFGYTNVAAEYRDRAILFRAHGAPGPDADRADIAIEDFGLAENLMIEIAIAESGGTLIRHAAPPGEEMTDLTGFALALEDARRHFTTRS